MSHSILIYDNVLILLVWTNFKGDLELENVGFMENGFYQWILHGSEYPIHWYTKKNSETLLDGPLYRITYISRQLTEAECWHIMPHMDYNLA